MLRCEDTARPDGPPLDHRLETPFVLVGRDPASDLVLDDQRVSRRHAMIQAIAGNLFCFDLQSRTRVRWGSDQEARAGGWLAPDEPIEIGPFRILGLTTGSPEALLEAGVNPFEPRASGEFSGTALPEVDLELPIQSGASRGAWRITGSLAMVGRSDDCQLVLTDDAVSRLHGYFLRTPAGVWVVDLMARQGVFVNGVRVRWAWLDEGDVVKFGPFGFRVRYDSVPRLIGRAEVPLSAGAVGDSSEDGARSRALVPRTRTGRSLALRPPSRGRDVALPTRTAGPPAFDVIIPPQSGEGGWEPTIEPPPNQMVMWRQQMQAMESFHHDMILMVQMFTAMHREHLKSVRDELDQVRRLTRELERLQKGLESSPGDRKPANGSSRRGADVVEEPEDEASGPHQDRGGARTPRPSQGRTPDEGTRTRPSNPASSARPTHRPAARSADTPPADDVAMHSALCKRIADIQKERQGYWRKILGAINK